MIKLNTVAYIFIRSLSIDKSKIFKYSKTYYLFFNYYKLVSLFLNTKLILIILPFLFKQNNICIYDYTKVTKKWLTYR